MAVARHLQATDLFSTDPARIQRIAHLGRQRAVLHHPLPTIGEVGVECLEPVRVGSVGVPCGIVGQCRPATPANDGVHPAIGCKDHEALGVVPVAAHRLGAVLLAVGSPVHHDPGAEDVVCGNHGIIPYVREFCSTVTAYVDSQSVIIAGAGIGGLTLALSLHRVGIRCRLFEATRALEPLGVGINLLPHAMKEMAALELDEQLRNSGIAICENVFFNRHGQLILSEPRGQFAGHHWPQVALHRGVLQQLLLTAVRERLGANSVATGWRFECATQDEHRVEATFSTPDGIQTVIGSALIGCDGIRSALRHQLHGDSHPLTYSGITMWRGVTRWPPFLTGASMVYAGALETGKFLTYPIDDRRDAEGRQLVNWLCEFLVPPRDPSGDWSQPGRMEDFISRFENMHLDWLDVPAFVSAAEFIFEYPMVDRDPLPWWTDGRVTLLGDAAHPMYPRGSNGAGQAILDAKALATALTVHSDPREALTAYEARRRPATTDVVLASRSIPPDAILSLVQQRTGGKPFTRIEDIVQPGELEALSQRYQHAAGFNKEAL